MHVHALRDDCSLASSHQHTDANRQRPAGLVLAPEVIKLMCLQAARHTFCPRHSANVHWLRHLLASDCEHVLFNLFLNVFPCLRCLPSQVVQVCLANCLRNQRAGGEIRDSSDAVTPHIFDRFVLRPSALENFVETCRSWGVSSLSRSLAQPEHHGARTISLALSLVVAAKTANNIPLALTCAAAVIVAVATSAAF